MSMGWKDRFWAAGIHAGASLAVAACAALLVFGLWYPFPYREVSGGRELFILIVSVDVVLGPLITFAVFSRSKPWPVMRRDLMVIVLLQLSALAYGLWTVYWARPVQMLFAVDRFQVVHASEVRSELVHKADPRVTPLPLTGPQMGQLRQPANVEEKNTVVFEAAQGLDLTIRPDFWLPYDTARAEVLAKAKPVSELLGRRPAQRTLIEQAATKTGLPMEQLVYLPLLSRTHGWTVLLDAKDARVLNFVAVESF